MQGFSKTGVLRMGANQTEIDITEDEFVFFDDFVKGPMRTTRPRGYRLIESGELPPLIKWGGRLGWWKSMLTQYRAEQIRRAYDQAGISHSFADQKIEKPATEPS